MMPYLQAVDSILPQDVAARACHRQRTQVRIGNPHRKSRILLAQSLTTLDDRAKEMPDVPPHSKLRQADQQRHQGDRHQEQHRSPTVNDILHRATRDNRQRDAPHIKRQVLDGHQTLLHTRQVMFHEIGTDKRQHQHQEHLVHDHPKRSPEADVHTFVDEREHHGNSNHCHQVAQEHITRHRLQIASQLTRHNGSSTGTGADDARQDALHQNQVLAFHLKAQNQRHQQHHQQHLEHRHPQVPHRGAHLVEIHAQKRREQDQTHEQRQNGVKYRLHHLAHRVQRTHPIEYQIDDRARHNSAGQRPILQKSDNGFHSNCKITAKSRLTEHFENSFSPPTTTNCTIPLISPTRPPAILT